MLDVGSLRTERPSRATGRTPSNASLSHTASVGAGQESGPLLFQPTLGLLMVTLRAMPIAAGMITLATEFRFHNIAAHGLARESRNLDQFAHTHCARNYPGHRQHRVHLDPGRQTAPGTAGQGAANRFEPGARHAGAAPVRTRLDGQAHRTVVPRSGVRTVAAAASGVGPRFDSPGRRTVSALEKHP